MDNPKVNHVSLCTGYGGIDLGLRGVVGGLRTVAYCEIEAFVIANLVSKMEAGLLDAAPVWTNLKTFPFREFHGLVDIISGGYPCQGFSAAGKRKGKDDPRHLWPWIADGIRLCRPRFCFFENVEGHISLGLSTVVSDLEGMGYKVSWGIFSAAEVGAPHQRKRVFILAARDGVADAERFRLECTGIVPGEQKVSQSSHSGSGEDVAHGVGEGLEGHPWNEQCRSEPGRFEADEGRPASSSGVHAWPSKPGFEQYWWEPPRTVANPQRKCDRGQEGGDQTVGPNASGSAGGVGGPSSGREEEFLADASGHGRRRLGEQESGGVEGSRGGEPHGCGEGRAVDQKQGQHGEAQSTLGGDFDGPAGGLGDAELYSSFDNRTDELRLLGNGVVPATAAKAFLVLLEDIIRC